MPAFLINLLITLAIRFGIPLILRRFPGLPAGVKEILEEFLESLKVNRRDRKAAEERAKARLKNECFGIECEIPPKGASK